jgi:hypothetical protein
MKTCKSNVNGSDVWLCDCPWKNSQALACSSNVGAVLTS